MMTDTRKTKRAYLSPRAITVGDIAQLTKGHGTPVGDPPHDGTTGYYNAAGQMEDIQIDLEGR